MRVIFCVLGIVLCALSTNAFPTPRRDVPPQCIDPTFACQDLESAKLCHVVKECIHEVWSSMTAPDDNDEVCDICKEMVKEARDQLLSNMTQEEIKEVFEGSCKLIPVSLIADGCIKIVDEIIPQLVEMLASRMDPNMVCTVSGMCNVIPSVKESHLSKFFKMILEVHDVECQECTTMMADVKTFLNTIPEASVENYIETFCDEKVPKYLCDILVSSYFPSLYSYIKSTDAKTLCGSVGICPKSCKLDDVPQVNDELTCEFCEHVLQHVKDLVTANTTAEEFRTALENFCKQVGSFSDKCLSLVNNYYDMLFDYIRKLDTKGMCTLIGLCNNEKCSQVPLVKLVPSTVTQKRISLTKLQPASRVTVDSNAIPLVKLVPAQVASKKDRIETNDIFPQQLPVERFIHPLVLFQKDTDCAFCRAVSFFMEKDLNGVMTEKNIKTSLRNVCDQWMKDFPEPCKKFLNRYSVKMQDALSNGVKLEDICTFSEACVADDKKQEINVRVLSKDSDRPFCELCKDAMTEVENVLSDPSTKAKLENLADQGCNVLPQSLRGDCTTFVNTNVEALIDILQQELQPNNICPALQLCDKKTRLGVPARVKDLECDLCKDVVSNVRQKLSDPAAKQTVLSFLDEGCAKLPGSLAEECKTFVNENIDTLIGMIIEQLDPNSVCSKLKICPASLKKEKPEKVKGVECELCKEVVRKVEDLIVDKRTEDEIQKALDKVCSLLPSSYSAECKTFVDQYTDLLITLLKEEVDPEVICTSLNLCSALPKKEKPEKVKGVECELCKEVVGKVEDLIKDKKTEDEIQKALDKVCSYLPSSYSAECKTFVDQYTQTLITLLIAEADPDVICTSLNICPALPKKEKPEKVKGVECELCKEVVGKVEDLIKDKKTEDEIQKALDKVCSYLPSSLSAECKTFVDQYTQTLITLLIAEGDPDVICTSLNICPDSVKKEKPKKFKDLECDLCKEVVGKVEELVKDKKTEDEIQTALDKVCSLLPSSLSAKCKNFVDQYTKTLITLLMEEVDPDMICASLNICPAQDLECQSCQYGLHYLQDQLSNADTQDELKNLLKKVCDLLPETYAQNCDGFVNEYGSALLVLLAQEIDPNTVCYELQMCTSKQPKLFVQEPTDILHPFKTDECSVCTTVVDYVDKLLEEDDVDKEITKLVEKVCTVLPASYKQSCSAMLETYGPYILQMIGQVADSKQVCQEIELCSRPPGHVHLLGGNKCTFGPSYWCKSSAHASACKAEMFCKEKVWKN